MKAMVFPNNLLSEKKNQAAVLCKSREKWMIALSISFSFGVLTGLFGLVINGVVLLGFLANNRRINQLGIWLIVVTFPLAELSAHCLDKIDEAEKSEKSEYYRRHGLMDRNWH